ncbi:autotransporter outer membrane beta-barrel domain-containing protein [Escherichia coli]|uniref:autotransporter outer membrane beta-barrel domain-containing protein n=1 Tax=Escherichia coli TaxID=562 RepID=UPI0024DFCBFF|nr:autotransporter outer membrane beta-barrel domain-containing protein [Escherichia coli]
MSDGRLSYQFSSDGYIRRSVYAYRENYSFKGNGWNNGVGVSAQYNKQHTFYLEADYTQGNLFDQKQVNGGYRFSF